MIFFTYHCIVQFTVHHIRFKRKKSPTAYLCTRIEQHLSVNSLLFVAVHNAVDNILSILNNNDNILPDRKPEILFCNQSRYNDLLHQQKHYL